MHQSTAASATSYIADNLDDLASLSLDEARKLYRQGELPSLAELDGAPKGRLLTTVGSLGPLAKKLRHIARSSRFPWDGKSFQAKTEHVGEGINRARIFGMRRWFRFETEVGTSAIDGKPCVVLNYDLPENPWFIRAIHDELRRVGPGLYLGPAMWKTKREPKLVLFFGLQTVDE